MRVYLDNCCLNRPFDDQTQLVIYLETQAVLAIQEQIIQNKLELVWSYMNIYENSKNVNEYVKNEISRWINYSKNPVIQESPELLNEARLHIQRGVKLYDALHFSCSIIGNCDFFISTDKKLLKKLHKRHTVKPVNPIECIEELGL
jgi:predicted nucleic acid-binding protein